MVATRFAVASHILLLLAGAERTRAGRASRPITSVRLAVAVDTNPVVIRRITGQLSRAGLIRVNRGLGGAELARPPRDISLGDIWVAVHAGQTRPLVPQHETSAASERETQDVLASAFARAEHAFQTALEATSLADLAASLAVREPVRARA